jgi:hypothetical protein
MYDVHEHGKNGKTRQYSDCVTKMNITNKDNIMFFWIGCPEKDTTVILGVLARNVNRDLIMRKH